MLFITVHLNKVELCCSFVGGMNNIGGMLKRRGKNPVPGPGDIRRAINEFCILPMSISPSLKP